MRSAFSSCCANAKVTSLEFGLSGLITIWMLEGNFEAVDDANWRTLLIRTSIASPMLNCKRGPGPMTGRATVCKRCSLHKSKHLSSPFSSAYKKTRLVKIIPILKSLMRTKHNSFVADQS